MKLKVVHGLAEAEGVSWPASIPLDLDSLPESVLERTRQAFRIRRYARSSLWSHHAGGMSGGRGIQPYAGMPELLDGAAAGRFPALAEAELADRPVKLHLRRSLEDPPCSLPPSRITDFHQATLPRNWVDLEQGLGEMVRPLERVGLYAPGGTAAYPFHRADDRYSGPRSRSQRR